MMTSNRAVTTTTVQTTVIIIIVTQALTTYTISNTSQRQIQRHGVAVHSRSCDKQCQVPERTARYLNELHGALRAAGPGRRRRWRVDRHSSAGAEAEHRIGLLWR